MTDIIDFFIPGRARPAMPRLLQLLSFPPATAVLLWLHTEDALSIYLAAYVVNGVGHKWLEKWGSRKVGDK